MNRNNAFDTNINGRSSASQIPAARNGNTPSSCSALNSLEWGLDYTTMKLFPFPLRVRRHDIIYFAIIESLVAPPFGSRSFAACEWNTKMAASLIPRNFRSSEYYLVFCSRPVVTFDVFRLRNTSRINFDLRKFECDTFSFRSILFGHRTEALCYDEFINIFLIVLRIWINVTISLDSEI